ncbi:MAG: hypothetical protein D6717_11870 [Gammaproteobacteria bacterium]|nr:MAG: hypothetical protein D6717_11870 [Gammaproteobacteria bacterium]
MTEKAQPKGAQDELQALRAEIERLRAEVEALRGDTAQAEARSAGTDEEDPLVTLQAEVERIRARAEEVGQLVREEVERRPLQALAIAAGIGWLLGRLGGGR